MSDPSTDSEPEFDEKKAWSGSERDADDETEPLLSKSDEKEDSSVSSRASSPEPEQLDPRFHQPRPSPYKRLGLILFIIFAFWLGLYLRNNLLNAKKQRKIIYASRYSKEHKFRPAASPIITETLKDGRIRLRGATPPPVASPTKTTVPKKKRKPGLGKPSRQKKANKQSNGKRI